MADIRLGGGRKTDRYRKNQRSFPVPSGKKEEAQKLTAESRLGKDDLKRISSASLEASYEIETKRKAGKFDSTRKSIIRPEPKEKPTETNKLKKDSGVIDFIIHNNSTSEDYKGQVIRNIDGKVIYNRQAALFEAIGKTLASFGGVLPKGTLLKLLGIIANKLFSHGDLEEVKLERLNLKNANLKGRDLSRTRLYKTNFEGADLRGAKLIKADAHEANFKNANLEDADLSKSFLDGADFTGANLKGAILDEAWLEKVIFKDTDLSGASFKAAMINDVNFKNAKSLKGTIFDDDAHALGRLSKEYKNRTKQRLENVGLVFPSDDEIKKLTESSDEE